MSKPDIDIIIIGGGAAGLMAAGKAAESGAKVLLLEKQKRLGHKLSISGKGRCNLTNTAPLNDFIRYFGKNGKFLRQSFNNFFSDELTQFFRDRGVAIKSERGGRIFPKGDNAMAVVEALIGWVKQTGVTIKMNSPVISLDISDSRLVGVTTKEKTYPCRAAIIATGGVSYPATGSTGDGYRITEMVGHSIVPIRPALVGLRTRGETAKLLQGLSLKNVNARLFIGGKKRSEKFGEMLFTHFGLSGPIILTLSRNAVDALRDKGEVLISVDLKPALNDSKLDARLLRDIKAHGRKQFHTMLKELLPSKMIDVCCESVDIPRDIQANQLSAEQRRRLKNWLKDFRFEITGHRSADEAIVTAGGVSLSEIDPRSMSSRIVSGLYLAGELIDVDGETGGFNLQAAFSTGWLAGESAATYCLAKQGQTNNKITSHSDCSRSGPK